MPRTSRMMRLTVYCFFVSIIFFLACSSDESPTGNPPLPQLTVSIDTTVYYSTPEDSLAIEASITGNPVDAQWYCSFGEGGTHVQLQPAGNRLICKHLFASKGSYTLRIWGEANGAVLCADTATINVQDYIRPSEANTVTVRLDHGVFTYESKHVGDSKDTAWISTASEYFLVACSYDRNNGLIPFPFNRTQKAFLNSEKFSFDGVERRTTTVSGFIEISSSGDRLVHLNIIRQEDMDWTYGVTNTKDTISISDIPLNHVFLPNKERAVYSLEFDQAEGNLEILTRYSFGSSCTSWTSASLVNYIASPKFHITVEFSKQ